MFKTDVKKIRRKSFNSSKTIGHKQLLFFWLRFFFLFLRTEA